MPGTPQTTNTGAFIPTTNVWDVDVSKLEGVSEGLKEVLVRLYQNISNIAHVLNVKETSLYPLQEYVCGQQYFPNPTYSSETQLAPALRQVYRTVINFGTLPNNTTTSVAHNITVTSAVTFTRIYGAASDTSTEFVPIPYASASNNNIEIWVDTTNVNIATNSNWSAYTICYVIVEYMKN